MNRELVVSICERAKLNVTIKPDGTLIGDPVEIKLLRAIYNREEKKLANRQQ